ncbi:MAG: hypothetical protein IIB53_14630 [Planctomycetes bacterium]|nr:hypothetical protein [Planctomycetota bacterium]
MGTVLGRQADGMNAVKTQEIPAERSSCGDAATVEPIRLSGGWSGRVVTRIGEDEVLTIGRWEALLAAVVSAPEGLPGFEMLKSSKAGSVFAVVVDAPRGARRVICKCSRPRGPWRRAGAMIRASRARKNWDRGAELLAAGIATPQPLALLERKGWGGADWLITEAIEDVVDLDQVALALLPRQDDRQRAGVKARLGAEIAKLFVALDRANLHHRDLKASNILLTAWDGSTPRVWLVDLDGLTMSKRGEAGLRRQRLVRLAASLAGYSTATRTDHARVLRACHALLGAPATRWRLTWRELAPLVAEYNRKAATRKHGKLDGFSGA